MTEITKDKRGEGVWLGPEMQSQLQNAAEDSFVSKSAYIRKALADKLQADGYRG